jgi:hypothetical protein
MKDFHYQLKIIFFFKICFRDIVDELETDYELRVVIPHCQQTKDKEKPKPHEGKKYSVEPFDPKKPLTTNQSNHARVCTKVRSMVERIFSVIKQNYSLDYVRNSTIGHLGIDLKNCCAFYNFTFKPVYYDGQFTEDVAQRLRNKIENNKTNQLEFLLKLRLAATHNLKRITLGDIQDFINCTGHNLRRKIFMGSFQYRMAQKSYVTDLIKRSKIYMVKPNKRKFDPLTKIIAVKMPSRFKRGKDKKKNEYDEVDQFKTFRRVFVQYTPLSSDIQRLGRKCDQINGYICSCKNGKRQAGCCSHVACIIYYLSCARNKPQIKFPGEYLNKIIKNKYKNKPR